MSTYSFGYVPKGKIRRLAVVTCAVDGCLHEMVADGLTATSDFETAGWMRRRGPRKTDGINWRCPEHPFPKQNPDERGYF